MPHHQFDQKMDIGNPVAPPVPVDVKIIKPRPKVVVKKVKKEQVKVDPSIPPNTLVVGAEFFKEGFTHEKIVNYINGLVEHKCNEEWLEIPNAAFLKSRSDKPRERKPKTLGRKTYFRMWSSTLCLFKHFSWTTWYELPFYYSF